MSTLSPDLVKKAKKEILREAKDEEHEIKDVRKDLARLEKAEHRAYQQVVKADSKLEQAETLIESHRDPGRVSQAQVSRAQDDLELSNQKYVQLHYAKEEKAALLEASMRNNDDNTQERNVKLNALSGPLAGQEAARVVPSIQSKGVDVKFHFD